MDNLMPDDSFHTTIELPRSPGEVFRCITAELPKWWGGEDYSGSSSKLNDVFIVNHLGAHFSRQRLTEVIPGKRVVWQVEESKLDWLRDQEEWTGTRMVFELAGKGEGTVLRFTHEGLVPEKQCYERCSEGWTQVITEWLYQLIVEGTAHFEL
jgi:uncharacterized protein YndB with AHSA1/START domain